MQEHINVYISTTLSQDLALLRTDGLLLNQKRTSGIFFFSVRIQAVSKELTFHIEKANIGRSHRQRKQASSITVKLIREPLT